jgi:hypothetical protein
MRVVNGYRLSSLFIFLSAITYTMFINGNDKYTFIIIFVMRIALGSGVVCLYVMF